MRARRALGLTAAAGAVLAAAAAADRRWRSAADPCGADPLCLPPGEERKVTTGDGAVLAVTVAGSGPAVVLAHCWTGNRGIWAPVARRLVEEGRTVVLYDQRGHGDSTLGAEPCTLERLADDLAAVLEALDVRDAVLAAHSMGGMAAQAFCARHPEVAGERLRALVLVATAATGIPSARVARLAGAVIAHRRLDVAMGRRAGHVLVRGTVGRRPRHGHLVATRDAFVATPPPVRRDFLAAMHAMDFRPGLGAIDLPTTVVIGGRDLLTPAPLGRSLAAAIPGARAVEWPEAGHMLPLEMPDELAEVVAGA